MTSTELAKQICALLDGVLIHQRQRWGPLLGHRRQYEAWWKAEFASAIESWAWTWELPGSFGVVVEPKPRDYGHTEAGRMAADLGVVPYDSDGVLPAFDNFPRVWLELKERGTWWGAPEKALGTANHGLRTDLQKWRGVTWREDETVLACQILTHDGDANSPLPEVWATALDRVASECPRFRPPITVGYPIGGGTVRWARLEVFAIHATLPVV